VGCTRLNHACVCLVHDIVNANPAPMTRLPLLGHSPALAWPLSGLCALLPTATVTVHTTATTHNFPAVLQATFGGGGGGMLHVDTIALNRSGIA
jgi:hypothetical protein